MEGAERTEVDKDFDAIGTYELIKSTASRPKLNLTKGKIWEGWLKVRIFKVRRAILKLMR
jgi:hypothetical protein